MDGRVYNYNTGPWNACNENFQAACLELQNPGIPNNREAHGMVRDPSKAMASASSFMFLNYPTDDHIHSSNQHVMHRAAAATQWQLPQWPKMKATHQGHNHKNFGMMKDDWSGMATNMHASHPLFNIPPPGPFCTTDLTDTLQDNCVTIQHPQQQQQNSALSYGSHSSTVVEVQQTQNTPPVAKPVVKKSNPQPRKKREKKKIDKEKKKRTRNEESWARNKRKKARARGESYMSVVGKVMRAKEVQPVDCSKCKFHCPDHVSEDDRQKLFKHYWSLESFKDKVNFLSDCVEEFVPLRPISGKRLYSRRYKLKIGEGEDEKIARVCKEFFISTFDISESTIVTFMEKKRKNPEEIKDNRGHQVPSNKTPPEVVRSIREHILSQTGLQGCLTKFHVEEVKNFKRLYTHYQSECEADDKKPASMSVYRKVYGDMHKDKTEAPVILPPEEVLEKISPAKKSKPSKDDSLLVVQQDDNDDEEADMGVNDDDDDEVEKVIGTLPAEPLNLTPPNVTQHPQQQQLSQPLQPLQQLASSSSSLSASLSSSTSSSCSLTQACTSSNDITVSNSSHLNQGRNQHHNHHHNHQNNHLHGRINQLSRQMNEDKLLGLNIPMTSTTLSQGLQDSMTGQQLGDVNENCNTIVAPSFETAGAHINQLMPFMWGTHRMTQQANSNSQAAEISAANIRGMQTSFTTSPNVFPNSNPHPMHHITQSCLFSTQNTSLGNSSPSAGIAVSNPTAYSASTIGSNTMLDPSFSISAAQRDEEVVVVKKLKKASRPKPKPKPKKEAKKRIRNEESWGRNIRKRLRFKGEEYISVKGKTVGAKKVQKVNCSKCKYKCSTKITECQRQEMNDEYWNLENYEKRIEFMSKYVQTYVPKRKMTGRRAYSRNYTFIIDGKRIRVCKNFFITTLHISESIVATCLQKARKGPSATKDMRGKHKPVNKTPEEVLQSIRELIIYLTGVRPKRKGNTSSKVAEEYQDINRLYLIYKYDSEQKGKKTASQGIFRNVLLNEFGFTGNAKFKKSVVSKMNLSSSPKSDGTSATSGRSQQVDDGLVAVADDSKTSQSASIGSSLSVFNDGSGTEQEVRVEVTEGSSTHPAFSTCLLSSF